jgi:transcriptional regulator with XRE-family HTH domain
MISNWRASCEGLDRSCYRDRSCAHARDVARLAGVSLKTASRVLNNSKNVSEEKVKRIRAAMKRIVVID